MTFFTVTIAHDRPSFPSCLYTKHCNIDDGENMCLATSNVFLVRSIHSWANFFTQVRLYNSVLLVCPEKIYKHKAVNWRLLHFSQNWRLLLFSFVFRHTLTQTHIKSIASANNRRIMYEKTRTTMINAENTSLMENISIKSNKLFLLHFAEVHAKNNQYICSRFPENRENVWKFGPIFKYGSHFSPQQCFRDKKYTFYRKSVN